MGRRPFGKRRTVEADRTPIAALNFAVYKRTWLVVVRDQEKPEFLLECRKVFSDGLIGQVLKDVFAKQKIGFGNFVKRPEYLERYARARKLLAVPFNQIRHQIKPNVAGAVPIHEARELPVSASEVHHRPNVFIFYKGLDELNVGGAVGWE